MRLSIVDGKAVFGFWILSSSDDAALSEDNFTNKQKRDFFHFVGHGLHAVQQGAGVLTYKDFLISASRIEDTHGGKVNRDVKLTLKHLETENVRENVSWAVLKYL